MQLYQFERIYSQMGNEFGKIEKGDEDAYAMLLFPMESNALKIYRRNPRSNSRRMREAIALVLFDIKSRIEGEVYDTGRFRDENNAKLEKALLMAFDPFTNEELREVITEPLNELNLHDYYTIPVRCLLRIKESIDRWEKSAGDNGYFDFIEKQMGDMVQGEEMHFSVITSTKI